VRQAADGKGYRKRGGTDENAPKVHVVMKPDPTATGAKAPGNQYRKVALSRIWATVKGSPWVALCLVSKARDGAFATRKPWCERWQAEVRDRGSGSENSSNALPFSQSADACRESSDRDLHFSYAEFDDVQSVSESPQ
jgi:hypothetical protein